MALMAKTGIPWLHVLTLNPVGHHPTETYRKTLLDILETAPEIPSQNPLEMLAASGYPVRILTGSDALPGWMQRLWLRENASRIEFIQNPRGSKIISQDETDLFRIMTLAKPADDRHDKEISSQQIRKHIKEGVSIQGMVPAPLADYIEKHKIWH